MRQSGFTIYRRYKPERDQEMLVKAGMPADLFLPCQFNDLSALLRAPLLAGALVHSESLHRRAIGRTLAARDGAILPMISAVSPAALLRQMLLEKTISVHTTAAGGHASLMTM